jgi:GcrA cell cycle regulator
MFSNWTIQELSQLKELWNAGVRAKDIAAAIQKSEKSVRWQSREIGLPRRRKNYNSVWEDESARSILREMRADGTSNKLIAERLGFCESSISTGITRLDLPRRRGAEFNHKDKWAPDRVERLKELWAAGHSATIITGILGLASRSCVLGKVHRLGLASRVPTVRCYSPSRPVSRRKPPPPPPPPTKYVTSGPIKRPQAPLTILDLQRHHCRWPVGVEGGPHLFCGITAADDKPYCATHCKMAYSNRPARGGGVYFQPTLGGHIMGART